MGSISDDLETKLLNHVFKVTSYSQPTHLYLALCKSTIADDDTGSTLPSEVSGGAYARKQCDTWTTASANTLSNNIAIEFTKATADWGTVTDFAICDHSSTGNVVGYGALSTSKKIGTDDTAKFATNDIDVSIS